MRRGGVLVAIVAAAAGGAVLVFWLVAGRDGGNAFDVAACIRDGTASHADKATQEPQTLLTLQEVRRRYDWFRFPSELPPGGALGQFSAHHRVCQPEVITISARIDGPNYFMLFEQSNFTATSGDPTTPIPIDGEPGELFDDGNVRVYSWNRDGHSYSVIPSFGGELTQQTLLRSLNTLARVATDATPGRCYIGSDFFLPTRTPYHLFLPSLQTASQIIGFDLLLPVGLPDDITMQEPFITRSSVCRQMVLDVVINYAGPDYKIALFETSLISDAAQDRPRDATPVRVNGFHGLALPSRDGTSLVTWRQGKVSILAYGELGGVMTQERFLQILESIPE